MFNIGIIELIIVVFFCCSFLERPEEMFLKISKSWLVIQKNNKILL